MTELAPPDPDLVVTIDPVEATFVREALSHCAGLTRFDQCQVAAFLRLEAQLDAAGDVSPLEQTVAVLRLAADRLAAVPPVLRQQHPTPFLALAPSPTSPAAMRSQADHIEAMLLEVRQADRR